MNVNTWSWMLTILLVSLVPSYAENLEDADVRVNRLSEQVLAVLEHYKSKDPVGFPGAPIQDPMVIPDVKTSLGFGNSLILKNQSIYGLSKFRILSFYSNLAELKGLVALKVDVVKVLGNYTITTLWFSKGRGASNTTITDLYGEGIAHLQVAKEGHLEATEVSMDLSVMDIDVHFENPGLLGSVLQGAMNSAGTLLFDAMKPYIMNEINSKVLGEVNKSLRSVKATFANSVPPLDILIAKARQMVRQNGYDPYKVENFTHTTGVLGLEVSDIWVTGLASFYRVGNITVAMENNTVYTGVSAGTKQLQGKCNWEVSMAGLMSTSGKVKFTMEYVEVEVKVNQSLDVRNRPNLEHLQITLGNFELEFDGAGTLDYVVEIIVNILPNLLRNQIMLAVEEPLKMKIQEIFNDIDVENTIKEEIQMLERSKTIEDGNKSTQNQPHEEGLSINESQLDDNIFDV